MRHTNMRKITKSYVLITGVVIVLLLLPFFTQKSSKENDGSHRETLLRQLLAVKATDKEWNHKGRHGAKHIPKFVKREEKRGGILPLRHTIKGYVFNDSGVAEEVTEPITTSLVHSFSPWVDRKLKKMFYDAAGENEIYAISPAIIFYKGEIIVVQRVWIAQYERDNAMEVKRNYWNTWRENYALEYRFNEQYKLLSFRMLTVPSPINCQYSYRADGVYDPRLSTWKGKLQMTFHLWMYDYEEKDIKGRMYIWDYDNLEINKIKMADEDLSRLQRAEINWIPIDLNGTMHFIYSFDPLRVISCEDDMHCRFSHLPEREEQYPFDYIIDRLRGGTPFIKYEHPYYISAPHSQIVATSNTSYYAAHLMVLCVDPFRIVYVSSPIRVHTKIFQSGKVVREHTISHSFIYPVGAILWNKNTMDLGIHLNDNRGFIIRIQGIQKLVNRVIQVDKQQNTRTGPPPRTVQNAVGELTGNFYDVNYL